MHGVVVSYDREKRFGFIRPSPGGQDIFFHISEVISGARTLAIGARVTFEVERSDRGYRARGISFVSGGGFSLDSFIGPRMSFSIIAFAVLAAMTCLLVFAVHLPLLVAYLTAANIVAAGLCAYDKGISGGTKTRVPEVVLYGAALIGGSAGLLLAMKLFRHKTRKTSFHFGLLLVLVLQVAAFRYCWEPLRKLSIFRPSSTVYDEFEYNAEE